MGIAICRLDELSERSARGFSVGSGPWPLRGFVVRVDDSVFAYVNRCPHAGHPLNLRPDEFFTPDQKRLLCQSHGALFEPSSGECVDGPCTGDALTRLPVRVEAGVVMLDGDADELARMHA